MIEGLTSVNSETLYNAIVELGEPLSSFEFPVKVIQHSHQHKIIHIKRKNSNNYFFRIQRIEGKTVNYKVNFRPANHEEQTYHHPDLFVNFSQVIEWFKNWFKIVKELENAALNTRRILQPETAKEFEHENNIEPVQVEIPKIEITIKTNSEQDKQLIDLLPYDKSTGYLNNIHETNILEYKGTFEWEKKSDKGQYIKTLANFYNRDGGYIVFGIRKDGYITGINADDYNKVDTSKITDFIDKHFDGNIFVGRSVFKLNGVDCAVLYVGKAPVGEIISCIKELQVDGSSILRKEDVYYRHNGKNGIMPFHVMKEKLKHPKEVEQAELQHFRDLEDGNPLFPLKVTCTVEIDYSKAKPEYLEHIDNFLNYLKTSYPNPYEYTHDKKKIPDHFRFHSQSATYNNFKIERFSPAEIEIQFYMFHNNIVKALLPEMFLAFFKEENRYKSGFDEKKANVFIKLTNYSLPVDASLAEVAPFRDNNDVVYSYTIDFYKKKINVKLVVKEAIPVHNDGLIRSVFTCKKGGIAIGYDDNEYLSGLIIKPQIVTLNYGVNLKQVTDITFLENHSKPWEIYFEEFWHRKFLLKKGQDIIQQHIQPTGS